MVSKYSLSFAMLVWMTACAQPEPAVENSDVKTYEGGKGRIVDIVADGNMAVIRHDEIPGFMMGMTMTFGLREDSIRSAVQPNDSIHFNVALMALTLGFRK